MHTNNGFFITINKIFSCHNFFINHSSNVFTASDSFEVSILILIGVTLMNSIYTSDTVIE